MLHSAREDSRQHPILVQRKRATALQLEWGDKPCDHPALAKEYEAGTRTGNYACTQCGKVITFRERAELLAARGPKAKPETD